MGAGPQAQPRRRASPARATGAAHRCWPVPTELERMADVSSPQTRRGQGRQQRGGQGRPPQGGRGGGRPLPHGDSLYTPGASDTRRRIERSSIRPLVLLHQMPVWLVPVIVAGLLVLGLAARGWLGAAALVIVAAFLGWLASLSWPRT